MENIENKYHVFEIINILFILSFVVEIFLINKGSENITVLASLNILILLILSIYGFLNKKNKILSISSLLLGILPILYFILINFISYNSGSI